MTFDRISGSTDQSHEAQSPQTNVWGMIASDAYVGAKSVIGDLSLAPVIGGKAESGPEPSEAPPATEAMNNSPKPEAQFLAFGSMDALYGSKTSDSSRKAADSMFDDDNLGKGIYNMRALAMAA